MPNKLLGAAVALLAGCGVLLIACSASAQQGAPGLGAPGSWHGLSAEELAETFHPEKLYAGIQINREECSRLKFAVWVEHKYGTECIRYFPSGGVRGASRAVFYFHGDLFDGTGLAPSASINNSVAGKLKEAQGLASVNRVPFVLVARPGAFGSSGEHAARRRPKEFYSLNAAVDAIKAKHGIHEVILSGQSGGATSVGALLTLGRSDVSCAVATSGGYDVLGRANRTRHSVRRGAWCDTTLYCDPYNVIDFTAGVKQDPSRRIFIVGDPLDSNTPFSFQIAFAEKLKQAGHNVIVVEAKAMGREHHGLAHIAARATGWCNAGLPTEQIVEKIKAGEYGLNDVRRAKSEKSGAGDFE